MKKIMLTMLFLFTTTFSQQIINSGVVLTPGGYRTFSEFLNNAPSITDNSFKLETDSKLSLYNDSTYELTANKRGRFRPYSENLWGYCDGQKVYMAVGRSAVVAQKFRPITLLPFYSYYSEPYTVPSMVTGGRMGDPDIVKMSTYLLISKTGQKTELTKPALREILRKEDTALYQEFLADTHSAEHIIDYLTLLNKRLSEKQ